MVASSIILDKIGFLGLMVLIGFLALKLRYVKEGIRDGMSMFLVRMAVPSLVISTFASMDMTPEKLKSGAMVLLVAYIVIFSMLALGHGVARLLGMKGITKSAHAYLSSCGNVIFLGYPIVYAMFGNEGLYYAMLYSLANDSIVWTLSIFSLLKFSKKSENVFKKLVNPNIISLILGYVIIMTGFKFPPIVQDVLTTIGSTTTPLSMIFIGATLATIKFSELKGIWKALFIVLIKMIIIPIILMQVFSFSKGFIGIPTVGLVSILMEVAMPCQSIYAALAKEYGGDVSYATQCILVTTLLSFVTLPFIYFLIERLGSF